MLSLRHPKEEKSSDLFRDSNPSCTATDPKTGMQCSLPVTARKSTVLISAFSPHSGAQSRSACCDSIRIVGHNEPGESSQPNSFAYFCFGFLFVCFFSALVDGFQTQGTLRNEMEKAVTRCAWCQGMAVTHGSWRLEVHLTLGPQTALSHLWVQLLGYSASRTATFCFTAPADTRKAPAGFGVSSAISPLEVKKEESTGRRLGPRCCTAQFVPGAGCALWSSLAFGAKSQERTGRYHSTMQTASFPLCHVGYSQQSLPGTI